MAHIKNKVPDNIDGQFFVDTSCINCDVCRKLAPGFFADNGEYSYVKKDPQTKEEITRCQMALVSCPVGSIGSNTSKELKNAKQAFPLEIVQDTVFYLGYTSKNSYGADSYFIKSSRGNWMIDSPRFNQSLAKKLLELGGVKYIFLYHRDDVADADKYAEFFKAQRIIHQKEKEACPNAEIVLAGTEDYPLDDAVIIMTPGHTEGHMCLAYDSQFLFTGDHFAWSRKLEQFTSFRDYCWYSWEEQIKSVEKLKKLKDISWVLPGHGRKKEIKKGSFPQIIKEATQRMRSQH